jgi:tetratricopeptide (TPR) repeat protein
MRLMTIVALALVAGVAPAAAAPIDEARTAFNEGKAAFERGDYETALRAYQKANMILPAPNLYFNIGAVYEKLGRYQEAALAFDKYFELAGPPQTDDEREFQDKLHQRAGADRQRPDAAPAPTAPPPPPQRGYQQQPPPPPQRGYPQQPQYQQPYYQQQGQYAPQYAPQPYMPGPYLPPPSETREYKLERAQMHKRKAITLMAIGVPFTVGGIILSSYATEFDAVTQTPQYGVTLWAGLTLVVVGTTLWVPGAFSYVRHNKLIHELGGPNP